MSFSSNPTNILNNNSKTDVLFMTQDSAYPQMGVLYLIDALRQKNVSSDAVSCKISMQDLKKVLLRKKPNIVGMSVMTAPQVKEFEDHSIWIKKNFPEIKIVWGGVHPTILSKECSVSDYIDHVFIGQGEIVFPNLVLDIINGENTFPKEVRGHSPEKMDQFSPAWDKADLKQYIFSEKHSVRSPVTKIHKKADSVFEKIKEDIEITDPKHETQTSRRVLDDIKKWDVGLYELDKNIFYYLLSSRGCPYKCTFCSEPLQVMHGDSQGKFLWNSHSLDWVKQQVETVRKFLALHNETLEGLGFWDDMFWVKYLQNPRAYGILDYLKEENLTYLIEARADQLIKKDFSLFRYLGETGCSQVFIGAESASQETLNLIRKGTRLKDYYRLMEMANKIRVALRMSFIIGFPNETEESVNKTLDFCAKVEKGDYGPWVNVSGPKIFTPYPGTEEYGRAVAAGFKVPSSHVEWGKINRSTEAYLESFPWIKKYSKSTLSRLEFHFGKGYSKLIQH